LGVILDSVTLGSEYPLATVSNTWILKLLLLAEVDTPTEP
jgi:hypothetical protein